MKLVWHMLRGFAVGLITAPIYAVLYIYDMTYTMPMEAKKRGSK